MNVSIATVANDVGTTVTGIQTAITLYTLVMATLMLTGGKIGAIIGRRRAFTIGCVIYAVGSLTTALSHYHNSVYTCVPYGSYRRSTTMHPAFQECIRRLYLLPTRLSMTAIREHTEMQQVAMRLSEQQGKPVKLPSYAQVRKEVHRLGSEPELVAVLDQAKSVLRPRESAESFVLSIPSPALLTQVDEHTMDLYVVTPSDETVASRVHAAVLICVKTAAILGAVLALGPLKEEDYVRLVKISLERKDHLVGINGCEHSWPCFGKPAIIFHDRGKIFTSERARQVLVDRLGIITEQAPPYAPSAKGTVESLFRWMTERFEKRLPNSSYGVHDPRTAAQPGGMTLEELERCFKARMNDGRKIWKLSPMDVESHRRLYDYSRARDAMFEATDTEESPWYVINSNDKRRARLNCIAHLLSLIPYQDLPVEEVKLGK